MAVTVQVMDLYIRKFLWYDLFIHNTWSQDGASEYLPCGSKELGKRQEK